MYVRVCVYACMRVCVYVCACMRVCVHACMRVCVYMWVHMREWNALIVFLIRLQRRGAGQRLASAVWKLGRTVPRVYL
jgi:hypothetical protein